MQSTIEGRLEASTANMLLRSLDLRGAVHVDGLEPVVLRSGDHLRRSLKEVPPLLVS